MKGLLTVGLLGFFIGGGFFANTLFANDDEVTKMKLEMAKLQAEMKSLQVERENLRSNAGGEPESLQSANGQANIRIGGDVRIRYGIGSSNGYERADNNGNGNTANFRSTSSGWALERFALNFDIELSPDTSAVVGLRLDGFGYMWPDGAGILDQAYWQWDNVGGTKLSLKVGLTDAPLGMWLNTDMGGYDWGGVDRALISDPFVEAGASISVTDTAGGFYGANVEDCLAHDFAAHGAPGIYGTYKVNDELTLKAGVLSRYTGGNVSRTIAGNDLGLTPNNEIRNIGLIDHVFAIGYNPASMEGLHLEASYLGQFDMGSNSAVKITDPYGVNTYDDPDDAHGEATYLPTFDFGVVYVKDKWTIAAEIIARWNPHFVTGFDFAFSAAVDYRLTEKLMLGVGFDWLHSQHTGERYELVTLDPMSAINANIYRMSVGGKYDFGNGIYLQAQYYHQMMQVSGFGDQNLKDADVILLQTGYRF